MKKMYRVKVEARVDVTVVVEADDRDEALESGAAQAKAVIERQLPHRKDGPYSYVAVEAHEWVPPKRMQA